MLGGFFVGGGKQFNGQEYFAEYLSLIEKKGLYPAVYKVDGPSTAPEVVIANKKYLTFCSNNYLGIANHPEINSVAVKGIEKFGIGSGSTRLLSGSLDVQYECEKVLANFFGYEEVITFSSGYLANVGVIKMLIDPFPYFQIFGEGEGVIFSDAFNHASVIDGIRLSKARREVYPHSDMNALEHALRSNRGKRKLILTDGIFSMDGDAADLKRITELAREYNAIVMVDDSHGVGVLGPHGEGTAAAQGVNDKIDVFMGSFTKAFGSIGGFIATSKTISEYLRITARSYIFSDPIPPLIASALIKATRIVRDNPERRKKVLENAEYLRESLKKMGLTVLGGESAIVPILIGDEKKAMALADSLFQNGILAPCIRRPAVAEGMERIRFSVMATHTRNQIDRLLTTVNSESKKSRVIQ